MANLYETDLPKELDDLTRLEDRYRTHRLADSHLLQPDELTLEFWISVLEEQFKNFAQIPV